MPNLVPSQIPFGRIGGSAQPTLAAEGGLILRPWLRTDAPAVVAAYADPDIQRWHARRVEDDDEARVMIDGWQRGWAAETSAQWAVVRDERRDRAIAGGEVDGADDADIKPGAGKAGGLVLGRMALRSISLDEGRAECAYWTVPAARGLGVAPHALSALVRWAFKEIGFHRLELEHSMANQASCRVATKAGFAAEGTKRSALLHEDGWHDMHLHARISEDAES